MAMTIPENTDSEDVRKALRELREAAEEVRHPVTGMMASFKHRKIVNGLREAYAIMGGDDVMWTVSRKTWKADDGRNVVFVTESPGLVDLTMSNVGSLSGPHYVSPYVRASYNGSMGATLDGVAADLMGLLKSEVDTDNVRTVEGRPDDVGLIPCSIVWYAHAGAPYHDLTLKVISDSMIENDGNGLKGHLGRLMAMLNALDLDIDDEAGRILRFLESDTGNFDYYSKRARLDADTGRLMDFVGAWSADVDQARKAMGGNDIGKAITLFKENANHILSTVEDSNGESIMRASMAALESGHSTLEI